MAQISLLDIQGVWQPIRNVPRPLLCARVMLEKDVQTMYLQVRVEALCDLNCPSRVLGINQCINVEEIESQLGDFLERWVYEMLSQLASKAEQEIWNYRPVSVRAWEADLQRYDMQKNALYQQQLDALALTAMPAMLSADTPLSAPKKKPEPDYNPSNAYRLDIRDLTEKTNNAMLPVIAAVVIDL